MQTQTSKSLLIIEDEKGYRDILEKSLAEKNITILTADNGKDALNVLMSTNPKPDLIILDLMMPEMTGWSFINKLKDLKIDKIPIIILTNLSESAYPSEYGAKIEFLVKANTPFKTVVDKVMESMRI